MPRQGVRTGISTAITVVLVGLSIVTLPFWKYSRHWVGGYKISGISGAMLAVHMYTFFSATT